MNDSGRIPRRTVEEIIARYRLEPNLQDLYVEGIGDKNLYGWYLKNTGRNEVLPMEIGSVDIRRELLESYGLSGGNRNRVIALSLELDRHFPETLSHVRCIADSDFDYVLSSRLTSNHLLYTDYTSVDLYTYNRGLFVKVLVLGFNFPSGEIDSLVASMNAVLQELFVIRASNQSLNWGMPLNSITRRCSVEGYTVKFDRDGFVASTLNSAVRMDQKEEFETVCKRLAAVPVDDPRRVIHGEDYLELLGWYLRRRFNWDGYRREKRSILRAIRPAIETSMLSEEPLFVQLGEIYPHK